MFFHSCGNVYPLIGDLVDIGVDILNPVQVSSPDLADTARLPLPTLEAAWAVPLWTVLPLPVAVAALVLITMMSYQKTFAAPTGPGSS